MTSMCIPLPHLNLPGLRVLPTSGMGRVSTQLFLSSSIYYRQDEWLIAENRPFMLFVGVIQCHTFKRRIFRRRPDECTNQ